MIYFYLGLQRLDALTSIAIRTTAISKQREIMAIRI